MKKLTSIFLILILSLTVFAFVGCNGEITPKTTESNENTLAETLDEKSQISLTDKNYIRWIGRVDFDPNGSVCLNYSGNGFEVKINGTRLDITLGTNMNVDGLNRMHVTVIKDSNYVDVNQYAVDCDNKVISVKFQESGTHTVKLVKNNEPEAGSGGVKVNVNGLKVTGTFKEVDKVERFIEVYGDSITCGYGNIDNDRTLHFGGFYTNTEDGTQTYWFKAAQKLNADCSVIAHSGFAVRYNPYGAESTQTSIPELSRRKSYYDTSAYVVEKIPQAVVLNCGTNDYIYCTQGIGGQTPSPQEQANRKEAFVAAYVDFINELRGKYPGTHFFVTTSMMIEIENFKPLVEEVIRRAGGSDVHLIEFIHRDNIDGRGGRDVGGDGHPGTICHSLNGDVMYNAIHNVLGW